jgi:hypothetical protein
LPLLSFPHFSSWHFRNSIQPCIQPHGLELFESSEKERKRDKEIKREVKRKRESERKREGIYSPKVMAVISENNIFVHRYFNYIFIV